MGKYICESYLWVSVQVGFAPTQSLQSRAFFEANTVLSKPFSCAASSISRFPLFYNPAAFVSSKEWVLPLDGFWAFLRAVTIQFLLWQWDSCAAWFLYQCAQSWSAHLGHATGSFRANGPWTLWDLLLIRSMFLMSCPLLCHFAWSMGLASV